MLVNEDLFLLILVVLVDGVQRKENFVFLNCTTRQFGNKAPNLSKSKYVALKYNLGILSTFLAINVLNIKCKSKLYIFT